MHRHLSSRSIIQSLALATFLLVAGGDTIKVCAQSRRQAAPLEFAVSYNAIRANAPPGGCSCFYMSGGRAEVNLHFLGWLSAVAEVGGAHANNINSSADGVGRITYLFGPRVTHRSGHRLSSFAQVLFGEAHGFDGYFPTMTTSSSTANSFAFSTGGGLDLSLSHRVAVRVLQADYLYTQLPNAVGDRQNNLRLGAGIVFRIR
ncbi:peptidoglycan-associated lipoprotein [Edaphobacter lichenicola]|uniref:Peptidoglycan-associated lipoprotein n=1 Tax=Tunturiibacter empetritectus TaxID=3069691 RepID=A0A7W8MTE4_9BACT|nr:peptidoglycan-associated lipoprotein [Edaphobacter lichenicola]